MVLPPPPGAKKVRKQLSADAIYALLDESFATIPDHRQPQPPIALRDALLSAFALFSLKDPSLLAFDHRRSDANLKALFGIGEIPSDTQMREILDPLDPDHLRASFNDVFRVLQRGKALEAFQFDNGGYLLSLDGTGYFSSQKIHCPSCQVKEHKNGTVTYEHQMLAAVIVHPDLKEVIPLAPEPIQKQDGSTKNDCERNAARRRIENETFNSPSARCGNSTRPCSTILPKRCRFRPWTAPNALCAAAAGDALRGVQGRKRHLFGKVVEYGLIELPHRAEGEVIKVRA
jgi:hypothetical protein